MHPCANPPDEPAGVAWSSRPERFRGSVREALANADAKTRHSFLAGVRTVKKRANRFERIIVSWWYFPFAYVEVRDTRWKHYPCYMRMLVSFDLTNGKFASLESENRYAFARSHWGRCADELVGRAVTRYSDCGDQNSCDYC